MTKYHIIRNHEAPGDIVSLSVIFTNKSRHFLSLKMKQVAEDITVKLIGFTYVQGLRPNCTVQHKPISTRIHVILKRKHSRPNNLQDTELSNH